MQLCSVAYHFDPAFRGSKESQNNSFRTSFPLAMKMTVGLSHFSSFFFCFFCLILNLFSPPCCCSIQTDKNAEAAFAEGIGDWSSGIIWAFLSDVFKGTRYCLTLELRDRRFSLSLSSFCTARERFKARRRNTDAGVDGAKPRVRFLSLCAPVTVWRQGGQTDAEVSEFTGFPYYRSHPNFIWRHTCALS